MKKKLFILLLFTLFIVSIIKATTKQDNFVKQVIDYNNIKLIKKIETKYIIQGSSKSAIETINYYINPEEKNNFIDIIENAKGTFCDSFYESSFTYNLLNGFTKTTYYSEPENRNYKEFYNYKNNLLIYKEEYKNKNKTYNLDKFSADSIRLMELLTFSKLEKLEKIEATGFIVPGAFKIPFIFKFIKEETLTINNKSYDCLLFSGEINGILNAPAKLLFGSSKIWVLKKFPHIRVKADYFNKTFTLLDYNIHYK